MATARLTTLALALALGALGCRDRSELVPTPLDVRHSGPRSVEAGGETAYTIDVSVSNPTPNPQEIFLFVTAHNHEPRPPTRVIWPPSAEPELRNSFSGLIIAQPVRGYRVALAPGASTSTTSLLMPAGGRRVLKEYWVQAVDGDGQLVFDSRGALR